MQLRNLGQSGLQVSAIGLGCNNFGWHIDLEGTRAVVDRAIESGITLFDTADVYGEKGRSESFLGEVLGARRKDIVLATKFGLPMGPPEAQGASRRYIISAVEASLKRLKTDWIDLYQLHRPDPKTPIEETLRCLEDLIRDGKIRYIGCSDLPAWQLADAHFVAKQLGVNAFISAQYEYSLLERTADAEILPAMCQYGLGLLPYFPLASGLLTGKYRRDQAPGEATRLAKVESFAGKFMTETNWLKLEKLEAFARDHNKTLLELAFGWLLARQPVASVIAGVTKPAQIEQNARGAEWVLSTADLAEIDQLLARDDLTA
jgi:aryl-alcohol dehydrogenase-like predicted oxidoreductase